MPLDLRGLELNGLDLGGLPAYVPCRLPGGKTTWSHPSQALAVRGPTQWKRRYPERNVDPPSAAMLAGVPLGHLCAAARLSEAAAPDAVAEVAATRFDERAAAAAAGPARYARRWWITRARARASARP